MLKKYFHIFLLFTLFSTHVKGQIIDYSTYNKGIELKSQGDYSNAILSFGTFLQQYPSEYPTAYFQRGKTHLLLQQYEQAIQDLEKVIQLDATHKDAPYVLGKIFFQLKKYPEALKYLTVSIQLNPSHALSYNDRGLVKCQMRRFDEALNDFYQATQIDPTFAMAHNNAGAARYFKQDIAKPTSKDLRKAKGWFTKAIQKDPSLALAYRNRGTMHILTHENEKALLDLKKAQKLNTHDAMIVFYLGVVYADQLKTQKAFDTFRQSLEMNPQLTFAHEEMGNLYKETRQYDLAIYQYYQAQIVRPSTGDLYKGLLDYRSALVFAEQKNTNKMYESLEKAKERGAFNDQQLYRDFQKAKEFKPFRLDKPFKRFQKSLLKIKKNNKFLNPDLGWFRMRR